MNTDIYFLSKQLAKAIAEKYGEGDVLSQGIIDAIDYGNSSGEILMKVRFFLREFVKNSNDAELVQAAKAIIDDISLLIK